MPFDGVDLALPRLAFYTENYVIGGAERYLTDLVKALDARGYEVVLLSNRNPAFDRYLVSRQLGHIRRRVVPILPQWPRRRTRPAAHGAPDAERERRPIKAKAVVKAVWRYATYLPNLVALSAVFRSLSVDILHVNNGGYPAAETCRLAPIAARRAGVPVCIMTVHNLAEPPAWWVERWIDRWVEKRLSAVIAMSHAVAATMTGNRGFHVSNVRAVDLGLEVSVCSAAAIQEFRTQLGLPSTARVVGMVGAFEIRKGQAYLVRAFEHLVRRSRQNNVYLVLVGEGETRFSISENVRKAGLADRIVFAGYRPDAGRLISAFDVLVAPSTGFEGQGYVILEAMAHGVPVIASRVGGFQETVDDGVTGLLVPPANVDALTSALERMLADESVRCSMGRAGRTRYEARFTLQRLIDDSVSLYSELAITAGQAV